MLNNKGFAVSGVLYILLVVFLLFLSVCLMSLSSSSILMSKGVEDLVNGEELRADMVQKDGNGNCLLRIKYKGKTFYYNNDNNDITVGGNTIQVTKNENANNYTVALVGESTTVDIPGVCN